MSTTDNIKHAQINDGTTDNIKHAQINVINKSILNSSPLTHLC